MLKQAIGAHCVYLWVVVVGSHSSLVAITTTEAPSKAMIRHGAIWKALRKSRRSGLAERLLMARVKGHGESVIWIMEVLQSMGVRLAGGILLRLRRCHGRHMLLVWVVLRGRRHDLCGCGHAKARAKVKAPSLRVSPSLCFCGLRHRMCYGEERDEWKPCSRCRAEKRIFRGS